MITSPMVTADIMAFGYERVMAIALLSCGEWVIRLERGIAAGAGQKCPGAGLGRGELGAGLGNSEADVQFGVI